MWINVNLQILVLMLVIFVSETFYTVAQSTNYHDQLSYNSQQLQPQPSGYQQQQQLKPRYEIDVDTYYLDPATPSLRGNGAMSKNQTHQNDPPKQVGYRVEYDLIEPDPPTTPKPYPMAYYDLQMQDFPAQAQESIPNYSSAPQSQQYSSYASVATPTVQTANHFDAYQAQSYFDQNQQPTNYVNPSYPTQPVKAAPPLYTIQLQQLQARFNKLKAAENLRKAQLASLRRQQLAAQQGNFRQSYQALPTANQRSNQIKGTPRMFGAGEIKCKSLFEAWNLVHMKFVPSTCGARLRCPNPYGRPVQTGQVCMCCPSYASVVLAYRKAMQQRSQYQYRRY